MKRSMILLGVLTLALMVAPSQANFVQCPAAGGDCNDTHGTTDDADIINGSPLRDDIEGFAGNDIIFGGDGNDVILGDEFDNTDSIGDDVIFGGPGSDVIRAHSGSDILNAGPDDAEFSQLVFGNIEGEEEIGGRNDTINVFAGEITTCLFIDGDEGQDTVNLIGFGPYVVAFPFGQPGADEGVMHFIDPIGGGHIFIEVDPRDDDDTELINGSPIPNPAILPDDDPLVTACPPLVDGTDPID